MGVIYKLKPEIREFILASKEADPKLSCRSMVALTEAKFQTKVSKSSINALLKQSGLSMPVGRRRTKRKYTLKLKGVIAAQTRGITLVQEAVSPAIAAPAGTTVDFSEKGQSPQEAGHPPIRYGGVPKPAGTVPAAIEMPAPPEAEEKAKREAEEKARLLAELKAKLEVELKAKEEVEAKAKTEAEEKARLEAEEKARREAEERARKEAEEEARKKAEEKAQKEAEEARRKAEEEAKVKAEAEAKAGQEADEIARAEAEAREKRLAEEIARREAEVKANLEAALKAQAEAERKAAAEAEARVKPQAEVKDKVAQIVQTEGEFSGFGAIFLKAADYLMGGTHFMTEILKNHLQGGNKEILAKTECQLYRSLFDWPEKELSSQAGLWPLIQNKLTPETYSLYLNELQTVKTLSLDMLRATSSVFQEVRGIKVNLSDGAIIYLDGQLHTVWSTVHIPNDFSLTLYNTESYIKRYFQEDTPFVLFMAPGYDLPTKEFFDFIHGLEAKNKWLLSLTLFGNRFEEIEVIRFERPKKRNFIFGLWPWQFAEYRQVKTLGEFRPFRFNALSKDFYLADVEIELMQPNINEGVTLRGCALKTNLSEKARLIILSDLPAERGKPEEIAATYLNCWPNLEEAFQDYSRKVELFTYTASSQRFFSTENLFLNREAAADISSVFSQYPKTLDLYVRWYFLPLGYEDMDFPTIKERFYDLKAVLKKQQNCLLVTFQPPGGYPFLKDLEYACRRVNEKKVIFAEGLRLWLLL